jgi:peptidoglycan/LPS O-acetylase OafA/YrhL
VEAEAGWRYTYYLTPTQMQGLIMGCALGYELAINPRGRLARLLSMQVVPLVGLAGMAAVAAWLDTSPAALARYGYLAFGAGACLVVGHCFVKGPQRSIVTSVLGARPLTSYGKLSYEIYLIHMAVILGVRRAAPAMPVTEMIVVDLVIIVGVGALLYHFAERPVRAHGWRRALGRIPRPTSTSTRQVPAMAAVPVPGVAPRVSTEDAIAAGVTSSPRL